MMFITLGQGRTSSKKWFRGIGWFGFCTVWLSGFFVTSAAEAFVFGYRKTSEAQCTSVDLRNAADLPIRNQGQVSWCYAFAAADLLQFSYRQPVPISAADIAVTYNQLRFGRTIHRVRDWFSRPDPNEPAQTGFMKFAVQATLRKGMCSESSFPSENWKRVNADGSVQVVPLIEAYAQINLLQERIHMRLIREVNELPYWFEFPEVGTHDFYDVMARSAPEKWLPRLRDQACDGVRIPYPRTGREHFQMTFKGPRAFERINHHLSGQSPVGFDFFGDVLDDLDHPRKIDSLHTVLLYGRKYDASKKECVYLMRNSYGTDCSRYDSRIPCEGGYLWLRERDLYRSMTSIVRPWGITSTF